jgi:magnesium transporter
MLFEILNGVPVPLKPAEALPAGRQVLGFFNAEESGPVLQGTGLTTERLLSLLDNDVMSYENHDGFDLIRLNLPSRAAHAPQKDRVCLCLLRDRIFFFSRDITRFIGLLPELQDGKESPVFARLPVVFFERLTAGDPQYLEKLEKEISSLEDSLLSGGGKNAVKEIVSLRRRLLNLKHYYEQMLDVLDGVRENGNGLLSETALRYFHVYDGRTDRQYHSVLHLRDYVTQVREAYQAEVDISLNHVMKTFTVITAIFLPLTLIVGWYGMNLQMPELHWPYAYPAVIALSLFVVAFCLRYFKKNNWF